MDPSLFSWHERFKVRTINALIKNLKVDISNKFSKDKIHLFHKISSYRSNGLSTGLAKYAHYVLPISLAFCCVSLVFLMFLALLLSLFAWLHTILVFLYLAGPACRWSRCWCGFLVVSPSHLFFSVKRVGKRCWGYYTVFCSL